MAECLFCVQQAPKKQMRSRGATPSVVPGGDGFECPASGCKSVFDTAEEALEHGATHGLSGPLAVPGRRAEDGVRKIHADSRQRKTRCCAFLVALVVSLVALILVSPEPAPLSRYYCSGL